MKINIQKCVKWMTSFLAILGLVLIALPSSAWALEVDAYNPDDYIKEITVDGNTKTVTYHFDTGDALTNIWERPGTGKSQYVGSIQLYQPAEGAESFNGRTYFLGKEAYAPDGMPKSGVMDITDITPGATIELTLTFPISFEFRLVAEGPYSFRLNQGVFTYDKNGNYLSTEYVGAVYEEVDSNRTRLDVNVTQTFTFASDVAYILPYGSFEVTNSTTHNVRPLVMNIDPWDLKMTVDIDMILEQSQTMDEIKKQLDANGEKLDDMNDKLEEGNKLQQDTNDKLDEIIDGRPVEEEESENLKDEIANQGQIVDDALAEKDALLNKPDPGDVAVDLDDYIDPYYRGQVVNAFAVFTGLPFPAGMLSVVCGIIVVSYVLFGKKG